MNEKVPIERLLDAVAWGPVALTSELINPDGLYTTHAGTMHIGDITFRCYQLNNNMRLIDAEDVERFFSAK